VAEKDAIIERLAIRELVENWSIYRDNRDWDRFLEVWHDDGMMMTSWGGKETAREFIEAATKSFSEGVRILHSVGAVAAEIDGERAVAKSKLRIMQRAPVEGVVCDVTCIGINFDFIERRQGRWGLVLRQPVYERDFITPTDPAKTVELDPAIMRRRPDGYRRLAYLLEGLGYQIEPNMPTEVGPERDALNAAAEVWLRGEPLAWPPA
jgi:hypothetical protein